MTRVMQSDQKFINATRYLLNFTDYIENSALRFLKEKKPPLPNQVFMPCNHDGTGFIKSFQAYVELRGLPIPDVSCLTQYEGVHTFPDEPGFFTARDLDRAMRDRSEQVFENRHRIADVLLNNWTNPDVGRMYSYNTTSKKCIVNHVGGTRFKDNWYLRTSVTNAPLAQNLRLYDRQFLSEFMRVKDDGTLDQPLIFRVNERPPDSDPPTNKSVDHILNEKTTTILSSGRGSVGPHMYGKLYPEEIPAYAAAVDMSDLSIQQAEDARTPSSLAILLMPLALNLVPIALLAQVNSFFMLMYTLMSDVITVIPLAIKGVELILIGKQRHVAAAIRFSTRANGSLPETASMEMWTAECRARDNVLPTGIAFVVLAIVFIILGIALEFIAKAYVNRRRLRRRLLEAEHEPLVNSLLQRKSSGDNHKIGAIGATRGVPDVTSSDAWDGINNADYSAPDSY